MPGTGFNYKDPGKRGHIVADTLLLTQHFLRTQKKFLILFRNILCRKQCFPVRRQPKKHHGQQSVLVYQVLNSTQIYFLIFTELSCQSYTWGKHLGSYRVQHEKINFIFTSGHVIFCLLYKHQRKRRDLLCNHYDGDLFTWLWIVTCEDMKFSRESSLGISLDRCLYNEY